MRRVCNKCFKEKPINSFYKNPTSKSGHVLRCKSCTLKYKKVYSKLCVNCGKEFLARTKSARFCHRKCSTGLFHPNWKGGRNINPHTGYVMIYQKGHPNANKINQVKEHRLVMERFLGRYLTDREVVHHNNGIKTDNRVENLTMFSNGGRHTAYHHHVRRLLLKS